MMEPSKSGMSKENPFERHIAKIAGDLGIGKAQVEATAILLGEGGTVPFIARYRKEVTGTLDEVQITAIRDRLAQLVDAAFRTLDLHLDDRRLKSQFVPVSDNVDAAVRTFR